MKIIYFHQHFSTPEGSTGTRSYEMARRLVMLGHEVTIVCGSFTAGNTGLKGQFVKGKRFGEVDGINIIELELPYSNNQSFLQRSLVFFKYALQSIKVALVEDYSIIVATSTPLTAGIPGIFAKWFRRKKFIFEVRDLWPELPKEMGVIKNPVILSLLSLLEWCSYHSAHRCIGLSPGIVKGIEKRGIDSKKVTLVPNACDLSLFDTKEIATRPCGVTDNNLMAVFSGTHGIANGLDAVINAASELKKRNNDTIKFVLIGDGKLKPSLMEMSAEKGLDNIIFLPPVSKNELAKIMKSADIGLQLLANVPAFYYGTSPNKFFDYISSGLPVLTNYPGWIADLISKHECGYAINPEDPVAFADALEHAYNQKSTLPILGTHSKALAESCFDRDVLAKNWINWVLK